MFPDRIVPDGDTNYNYPYSHGNPQHVDRDKIDEITPADYGWTPETIKAYMFGVKVQNPETGEEMGYSFYNHNIEVAIGKAEKMLDIQILPRIIEGEHHDYHASDFNSFMYTHVFKRPIIQAEGIKLEINGRSMQNYPSNWWKVYHLAGHLELYPTAMMQAGFASGQIFPGYQQVVGMPNALSSTTAPQMIHIDYISGLLPRAHSGYAQEWECPADLEQLVIKLAMKEIFQVWGRLIIGAGIASQSRAIDGVSESIQTTQTAMYGGASADINQVDADIQELVGGLKSYFGMNLGII